MDFDFLKLKGINNLYIPLRYFVNSDYEITIKNLTNNYNTYIYLPIIMKDKYLKLINIEKIINNYDIKGFVISHFSQINIVKKYNLELIGNYTLNIFNNYSIDFLERKGLKHITLSPELSYEDMSNFRNQEIIIYGKIPVMTNQYCYLGKTNKCYPNCDKKCNSNNKYYLKDRMNCKYRIIPDNCSTITTIYNYRPIKIASNNIDALSYRIDILDEDIDFLKSILVFQ